MLEKVFWLGCNSSIEELLQFMDFRKWDQLDHDCLVNIFAKVGRGDTESFMESMLMDVPFVCKSWHKASLDPKCWERLIFPIISTSLYNTDVETEDWTCDPFLKRFVSEYRINKSFSITAFIKFMVNRSKGCATEIRLPVCASEEALKHVAASCPRLKNLSLPADVVYYKSRMIPDMIGKWKDLENLLMGSCYHDMEKIISQIGLHCKNFYFLCIPDCLVCEDAASAIAKLPNLKHIFMQNTKIERDNFVKLLKGCKNLVSLDARKCLGFDAGDKEISELASHISDFKCQGSRVFDRHSEEGKYVWFHDFVYDGY
ncbi:putative leucine-rich repeat domain, L domain-containing protein [Rosa chinensis]|uniref:Putative leucine-rich repeat domain, L domain-containing protein n=1 Tax=Rosa chinensis TaxID=74649 RepID=A0A2P6PPF0_ROSCH|nr:F-box/LRR-repeat protein At3g48880 isoform X1 [Rosa chinensis]PRQ23813.1 putative leucine-rich repeat domain, L domain-containing protein [Rosa chinensis]